MEELLTIITVILIDGIEWCEKKHDKTEQKTDLA